MIGSNKAVKKPTSEKHTTPMETKQHTHATHLKNVTNVVPL